MLTQSEATGLAIRGLDPQLRAVIGTLSDNRPTVLARATYASYTNVPGGQQAIMAYTFPGLVLAAGDQLRIDVGGSAINNSGLTAAFGVNVTIAQGAVSQNFGYPAQVPNVGASPFAWRSSVIIGVGVPGAQGQYVPQTNRQQGVTDTSVYASGNQPNQAITFGGVGYTLASDTVFTAGQFAGGFIRNNASPANGNVLNATGSPIVFNNQNQIVVTVFVVGCDTVNKTVTVQAGSFEGL